MATARQLPRWALALLLCLSTAGCPSGSGGAQGRQPAPGAPGAPGPGAPGPGRNGPPGNGAGAPGAPIKMPAFTQVYIDSAKADLETIIKDACGGSMCVHLRVEARVNGAESCRYLGSVPDLTRGAVVEREKTIILLTGTLPCHSESSPGDSPQPGDTVTPQEGPQQGTPGEGQPSAGTP
jgi:hypothetical protein